MTRGKLVVVNMKMLSELLSLNRFQITMHWTTIMKIETFEHRSCKELSELQHSRSLEKLQAKVWGTLQLTISIDSILEASLESAQNKIFQPYHLGWFTCYNRPRCILIKFWRNIDIELYKNIYKVNATTFTLKGWTTNHRDHPFWYYGNHRFQKIQKLSLKIKLL